MVMLLTALLLLCASRAVGQIHDSTFRGAPCYQCEALPCLQRITCDLNEVCQVNYDYHSGHFRFSCWEAQGCLHTLHLGGRHQQCCSNHTCLDNALTWIRNMLATDQTTSPPANVDTTGSHIATLNYDAISCDQLASESCAVMDALCPHVNCPDICKKCFKPIVTVPTTATPPAGSHVTIDYDAISCDQLANQECGVLDAVCPHVNCPHDCSRCYKPIVTVPTTTPPPTLSHGSDVVLNYDAISCKQLANQGCAVMDVVCPHVNCPDECQICFAPIQNVTSSPSP